MDSKQWPVIVRQHAPLVWQTAYRVLGHHADATDCLQETFVSAWKISCREPVKNWPGLLQHLATARRSIICAAAVVKRNIWPVRLS